MTFLLPAWHPNSLGHRRVVRQKREQKSKNIIDVVEIDVSCHADFIKKTIDEMIGTYQDNLDLFLTLSCSTRVHFYSHAFGRKYMLFLKQIIYSIIYYIYKTARLSSVTKTQKNVALTNKNFPLPMLFS